MFKAQSIGLFGGSFNPIHVGHIGLAREILRQAALDEVWLMVSPLNPFKRDAGDLLDDHLRYRLACLAVEGESGLRASDYEFSLPKPSYTWQTLRHLSADYPDCRFTLIIGADNWLQFDRWAHPDEILAHHSIIVYPREGYPVSAADLPSGVTLVNTRLYPVSSTEIRRRVAAGEPITGLVPPAITGLVEQYYGHDRNLLK